MKCLTAFALVLFLVPSLHAIDKAAVKYVQDLQTSTGGFLAMVPPPNVRMVPTLKATSAAVRALHYLKGEVPHPEGCKRFVGSCFDVQSGGFSDVPGGKPDVFTTAVGIMAVTELMMDVSQYADGVVRFLSENSRGFDDIRIAVAGLERLQRKSPRTEEWRKEVLKLANADGTFGEGPGLARDTGGSVVVLLRLGSKVANSRHIIEVLQQGQRKQGGFGPKTDPAAEDLETSYRIMRCFMMLNAQPKNPKALDNFLAQCRNPDGGYGMSPGQPSNVNATYFAAIIHYWLHQDQKR